MEQELNRALGDRAAIKSRLRHILSDGADYGEVKDTLTALNARGITYEVLSPLAEVLSDYLDAVELGTNDFIDTCGTGGSGLGVFNCSTLSAFVAAAAGAKVVKHGNRALSGKSGSADFLSMAGVNVANTKANAVAAFRQFGVTFLMAPNYHTKLANVAKARRELGVRTAFNVVGPLVNPAAPSYQLIGTSDAALNAHMARVLLDKGVKRALIASAADGVDEISLSADTYIYEVADGAVKEYWIKPEEFGFKRAALSELQVDSPEAAYAFGMDVLSGGKGGGAKGSPARDMVALNAGAALYVAGAADSIKQGAELAAAELQSGRPLSLLNEYAKFTHE